MIKFIRIKTNNLTYTQKQPVKVLGCSNSTVIRYRNRLYLSRLCDIKKVLEPTTIFRELS